MYRRHTSQLRPGMVLGKALYAARGEVLLGAGTVLTRDFIIAGVAPSEEPWDLDVRDGVAV